MSRELDIYKIVKIGLKALKRAKIPLYCSEYLMKNHRKLIVPVQYAKKHRENPSNNTCYGQITKNQSLTC